jgi:large subunit ribosomal protein L13
MNCYQAKAGELAKQWYVIDASGQVVGRLAAQIAPILMGKHRPTYTPHIDTGDYVIVTNVDKVVFTGNKWQEKSYQRYSGYPGGQRDEAAWKLFQRHPERILELAVQRMMPKSKLGRHMMDKLKLVVGPDHPHQAQQPVPLEPLSGRPASAGALFSPAPAEAGARKKNASKAEPKPERETAPAGASVEAATTAPPAIEAAPAPPAIEAAAPKHHEPAPHEEPAHHEEPAQHDQAAPEGGQEPAGGE